MPSCGGERKPTSYMPKPLFWAALIAGIGLLRFD
jgi:hypothetical protein